MAVFLFFFSFNTHTNCSKNNLKHSLIYSNLKVKHDYFLPAEFGFGCYQQYINHGNTHTAVSEHFLSSNHSHKDMLLIPLELLKSKLDSVRKAREAHLIQKAKTVEPLGLNRRNEQ